MWTQIYLLIFLPIVRWIYELTTKEITPNYFHEFLSKEIDCEAILRVQSKVSAFSAFKLRTIYSTLNLLAQIVRRKFNVKRFYEFSPKETHITYQRKLIRNYFYELTSKEIHYKMYLWAQFEGNPLQNKVMSSIWNKTH